MSLTDAEKKKIRAEEIFRTEVARSLDHQSRFLSFLNSPFGLWVLSSVFLAGLVSGIGWLSATLERHEKNQEMRERLAAEISRDSGEFYGALEKAQDYTSYSTAYAQHLNHFPPHFSQFKDATMDQLVWELHHLPRPSDKKSSQIVVDRIAQVWDAIAALRARTTPLSDAQKKEFDCRLHRLLNNETDPIGIMQAVGRNAAP